MFGVRRPALFIIGKNTLLPLCSLKHTGEAMINKELGWKQYRQGSGSLLHESV